jgi:hypothetical protein
MENNLLSFHSAILHVNLVADKHDGDLGAAYANQIRIPLGYAAVRFARGYVEENDGGVGLDIVAVAKATKLLLQQSQHATKQVAHDGDLEIKMRRAESRNSSDSP